MKRLITVVALLLAAVAVVESCGWDSSLREYLSRSFWLPFAKQGPPLERKNVRRVSVAYAGMATDDAAAPLVLLRRVYQTNLAGLTEMPWSPPGTEAQTQKTVNDGFDAAYRALQLAMTDETLTASQREEAALIAAKIDMRKGDVANDKVMLAGAKQKFVTFLQTSRNPAFASEARGWLARVNWRLGDQTAAGKMYLDELNRNGSNLTRETLLNSLRLVYGYDGGNELREHIADYFDTAAHAAFAVQLVTNPHTEQRTPEQAQADMAAYKRIMELARRNARLFASSDAESFTLLLMRTALRMGDPAGVLSIGEMVKADAPVRGQSDFEWMTAAAHFVSRRYASAEAPLLRMFQSASASEDDKCAAAYGLVGVYAKTGNALGQLYYALWLEARKSGPLSDWNGTDGGLLEDRTLYWASSGWDLRTLLDYQLPDEVLSEFIRSYPDVKHLRLVQYSLAVRLAREDHYQQSADLYDRIGVPWRARRMLDLQALYDAFNDPALARQPRLEAKYQFAEYLRKNSERIYFNDALWHGMQRYALAADSDARLDGNEHQAFITGERNLRDGQEERWRAYQLANAIVQETGKSALGRKAAQLALRCLRGISAERFGRQSEIETADIQLSDWLQK